MGFSLFGGSGDQKTSSTTNTTTYSASVNPQISQDGAAPGTVGINISPLTQGGSINDFGVDISTAYAPLNVTSTGSNIGDSALDTLKDIVATQQTIPTAANNSGNASTSALTDSLTKNWIYWVLGAVVVFYLAHHKH